MAVIILKLMTDVFWYLAALMPVITSVPVLAQAALLAVPCVYGGWLLSGGRKKDFSGNSQDTFLFECKVLAAVGFFELMIVGITSWQRQCGPFVFGFLVAGILLLRVCRISGGGQSEARFLRLNGLSMFPVLAAALVLASKSVRRAAAALLGSLYQSLVLPILLGILKIFLAVIQAAVPFLALLFPGLAEGGSKMEMAALDTDTKVGIEEYSSLDAPYYYKVIGILILVGLTAVLFYVLYRKITVTVRHAGKKPPEEEYRSAYSPEESGEQGRGLFGREKNVRYYYRKFLQLCRKKGMSIGVSATSEEIESWAVRYWPKQELSELGCLYRQVRYGNRKDGSGERQRAREIYKKLKDQKDE